MNSTLVRQLGLIALPVLFAACSLPVANDPNSPYAKTPLGSTLELNQTIEIQPGSTRVFIQNGQLTKGFNRYATNCNIEVRKIEYNTTQTIATGSYEVVRVQSTYDENVKTISPTRLAALGSLRLADSVDRGSTMVYAGYHLYLAGADPNVMRLSCRGAFADPSEALPPSITEIRQALGDIITLRLAE